MCFLLSFLDPHHRAFDDCFPLKEKRKKAAPRSLVLKKRAQQTSGFFFMRHIRGGVYPKRSCDYIYIYIYNQHTIDHDDHVCDHHHRTQRRSKRNARAEQRRQRDGEEKNNRHRRLEDVFVVFDV